MIINQSEIQSQYSKRFKATVVQRSLVNCISVLALHICVAALFAFAFAVIYVENVLAGIILYPIFGIFIATRYRALANILHEATHNAFAPTYKANNIIARLICIVLFYSLKGYKEHHRTHHAFTGDYSKDKEFGPIEDYELHKPLDRDRFDIMLMRALKLKHLGHYIGGVAVNFQEPIVWIFARLLYLGVLVSSILYWGVLSVQSVVIIGVFILPIFTFVPTITYIMDVMDHGGILGEPGIGDRARNYTTGSKLVDFIFFPHYDNYHLVHHIFPDLPTRLLPHCHEVLMQEQPAYRDIQHTLGGFVSSLTRQGVEVTSKG